MANDQFLNLVNVVARPDLVIAPSGSSYRQEGVYMLNSSVPVSIDGQTYYRNGVWECGHCEN